MEDTGIAVGFFVSLILDLHLEDIVPKTQTSTTWDCLNQAPYNYFSEVTDKEFSITKFWN
jgi:hypothetical protein